MKVNIFGMFVEEVAELIKPYGMRKFRALQIVKWMYQQGASGFSEMSNLSLKDRELLADTFVIDRPAAETVLQSSDNRTSKYLLRFSDGASVETVLMRQPYGNSVCVSTQVGCAMGCVFCASTLKGLERNLTAGEIFAQVVYVNDLLCKEDRRVDNIVVMGSGEPLANYESLLSFIRLCHQEYAMNLSYRSITVSTAGIVPQIERLSKEGIPVTLSISLHAPDNELRSQLMPINKKYPLEEVVNAATNYVDETGRRVTYEYILINNVNDTLEHADKLAKLMRGKIAGVNLIPMNSVKERGLMKPDGVRVSAFEQVLVNRKITVTVRRERGADIMAACGQLRQQEMEKHS